MRKTLKKLYRSYLFKENYGLSRHDVSQIINNSSFTDWFFINMDTRKSKKNVLFVDNWIQNNLPLHSHLHELGCGTGINLLRWHHMGYKNLTGNDIEQHNLEGLKKIFKLKNCEIKVWKEDALEPSLNQSKYDAILCLNWLSLIPNLDLNRLFKMQNDSLSQGGVFIFDIVDSSFKNLKHSSYNINDLSLPENQRRPSQYLSIFTEQEVENSANETGFKIVNSFLDERVVVKRVYVLEKL